MKIVPLFDYALVRPLNPQETTPGGIVIPDLAKGKSTRGTVLALGPTVDVKVGRHEELRVGAVVEYSPYAGTKTPGPEGEDFLLIRTTDFLAVVQE